MRDRLRRLFRRVRPTPTPTAFRDTFASGVLGNWEFETGGGFVGQQAYTKTNYVTTTQGGLHLIARPDRTSVRLISREAPFVPGTRLTYVAELEPDTEAVWPALWAIGRSVDWPKCGEVDVMEANLGGQWKVKQTVHTARTHAEAGAYGWGPNALPVPEGLALYSAEWRDGYIRFAVNGVETGTVTYAATEPMRLVMNVALRDRVGLRREWAMRVREVTVEPLPDRKS